MNLVNCRLVPLPAAIALLGLAGLIAPAQAGTLCPNSAGQNGNGNFTFTSVPGTLDATCGTNSAVTLAIPTSGDYARLQWTPGSGLTFGNLLGLDASVAFAADRGGDQPYYMLRFYDPGQVVSTHDPTDVFLMIENQAGNISGGSMLMDPSTTLFNIFNNTAGGYYTSQGTTNTVAGWESLFPVFTNTHIEGIRIGIGNSGGCNGLPCSESLTINSLDVASPEPATLAIVGTVLLALGLTRKRRLL